MASNLPQPLDAFIAYASRQPINFNVAESTGSQLPVLSVRIVRVFGIVSDPLPAWMQPTKTTNTNGSIITVSFTAQQAEILIQLARDSVGSLAIDYVQSGGVVLQQPLKFSLGTTTPNGTVYLVTVGPGGGGTAYAADIIEDADNRFVSDTEKAAWNSRTTTAQVTAAIAAANIDPAKITQDATHRLVTDTEKTAWNAKPDASAITSAITALRNGVPTAGDDLNKLYSLIQAVSAIVGGTTADGDSVVNTVAELLSVFATYPESVTLINALSEKLDTSTYTTNRTTDQATVNGKMEYGGTVADFNAAKAAITTGKAKQFTITLNGLYGASTLSTYDGANWFHSPALIQNS